MTVKISKKVLSEFLTQAYVLLFVLNTYKNANEELSNGAYE